MRTSTLPSHHTRVPLLHFVVDYPWSAAWVALAIVLTVVLKVAGL